MKVKTIIIPILAFLVVVGTVGAITMDAEELKSLFRDLDSIPVVQEPLLPVLENESDDDINLGSGGSTGVVTNLIGTGAANFVVSTTTATTTSSTIRVGYEADQIDLNVYVVASSTTSEVRWQLEFSNDGSTWFGEDTNSTSGNVITHQAATTTRSWTPGITEPATKNIKITDIASRYFRIKLFRGKKTVAAPGNNFIVWVEGIAKSK